MNSSHQLPGEVGSQARPEDGRTGRRAHGGGELSRTGTWGSGREPGTGGTGLWQQSPGDGETTAEEPLWCRNRSLQTLADCQKPS
ncbi:hypothetical protein GN956_G13603 [Arapaima gigas]